MTDTRITLAGATALIGEPAVEARITMGGVSALVGQPAVGIHVTMLGAVVLVDSYPCLTHMAQCWKITREDGQRFAYTTADFAILFGGVAYQPCDSLMAQANELGTQLGSIGNTGVVGLISDDGITDRDIAAGLFDGAEVEVWMVPWGSSSETAWRLTKGLIGQTTHGRNSYEMDVLTAGARLEQQSLLETVGPGCRYNLGDDRCKFDLYAAEQTGTVTALPTPNASISASRRVFFDPSLAQPDGYFESGMVEWQSGANAGLQSEVKDYVAATGQITLWDILIEPIAIGDTFVIGPGCDKASSTCKSKFNNYVNFGGFPHVPGQDSVMQTPESKG